MNYKKFLRPGNGATDISPLLLDKEAFHQLIIELIQPFSKERITAVAAIEGRGFILGSAVAFALQAGFIPVRTPSKLKHTYILQNYINYSGKEKQLGIHTDAVHDNDSILLVDDWIETGETIQAAIKLIEQLKGNIVGISVFMDDTTETTKKTLTPYNYHFLERVKPEDNF